MVVEKDDLGLSLSLMSRTSNTSISSSSSENHHHHCSFPLQLSLMPPSSISITSVAQQQQMQQKQNKIDLLQPFSVVGDGRLLQLRGVDVNRTPATITAAGERTVEREIEEEGGVSSPNSTVSSVSAGKRGILERDEADQRATCSRSGASDEELDGDNCRKKLRLSKDQSAVLEESFKEHNTLNPKQKLALAKQLNLRPRQVEVWFQNRRARTKLKQTEVDCEYLKRCCENLTDENRRLHKEVAELRALKLSPHFYMHMNPPTTLTMCPSCERVSAATAATATAAAAPPPAPATVAEHQQLPRQFAPAMPWAPVPLRSAFSARE